MAGVVKLLRHFRLTTECSAPVTSEIDTPIRTGTVMQLDDLSVDRTGCGKARIADSRKAQCHRSAGEP
jgi:hypothetical protein